MKWNGIIRAITISYLKLSLTFSVKIKCEESNVYSDGKLVYSVIFQWFSCIFLLIAYAVVC